MHKLGEIWIALENRLSELFKERVIVEAAIKTAEQNKNKNSKNGYETWLKYIDDEIRNVKQEVLSIRENVYIAQRKMNARVQELFKKPETSKQLEEELDNGYNNKIYEHEKEQDELLEKRERAENIKLMLKKSPQSAKNLTSMLWIMDDVRKLEVQLADPKVSIEDKRKKLDEIAELQGMIKNDKNQLMSYIKQNNLNILESDINDIMSKSYFADKDEHIDFDNTIDKNILGINREIISRDASIRSNIENRNNLPNRQKAQAQEQSRTENSLVPVREEPKWYQLVQRFKNWRTEKKENEKNEKISEMNGYFDREVRLSELKNALETNPELKKRLQFLVDARNKGDNEVDRKMKFSRLSGLLSVLPLATGMIGTYINAVSASDALVSTTMMNMGAAMSGITLASTAVGALMANVKEHQTKKVLDGKVNSLMNYVKENNINVKENDIKSILNNVTNGKLSETIDNTIVATKNYRENGEKDFKKAYGYNPLEQRKKQMQSQNQQGFRNEIRYDSASTSPNTRATQQQRYENREIDQNDMER